MKNVVSYCLTCLFVLTLAQVNAQDKEPISEIFLGIMTKDGVDAAIKEYERLAETEKSKYDFHEKHLRDLAFEIQEDGSASAARKVFALNAKYNSTSESHYYVGFINYELGNEEAAIESLEKSYELDAKNNAARDLIVRIKDPKLYDTYQYVCAPCYCAHHGYKWRDEGSCIQCNMKLVKEEKK